MSTLQATNLKHNASTSNNITLDSAGNVGIGTTTPSERLQINAQDGVRLGASGSVSFVRLGSAFAGEGTAQLGYDRSTGATAISVGTTGGALTDRARITFTGDFQFNSGYGSVATAYGCRAWVNFNGTGTVAIRASGNVSSITDNGTGNYTVNFTTAMPDANYSVQIPGSVVNGFARAGVGGQASLTASSVTVGVGTDIGSAADRDCVTVAIFR